jgi:hypothetical protein
MSEQTEVIYDYMIKHGKKLCGRKLVRRDKPIYADTNLAEAYQELIRVKGRLALFCYLLVKRGIFNSTYAARTSMFRYATQETNQTSIERRIQIREIYDSLEFKETKSKVRDIDYWNERLRECWT